MEKFCQEMPKIELHAHLSGSISEETIQKLLNRRPDILGNNFSTYNMKQGTNLTLESGFEKFKLIHELCFDDEAIYIATRDVINEFASDNVKYLELRTGPKVNLSSNMTKKSYIKSVLKAIKEKNESVDNSIIVKLIISIDRSKPLDDAWQNLELAKQFRSYDVQAEEMGDVIVGVDLSGYPYTTDVEKFIPVLTAAKNLGFKLTLHIAEIPNRSEECRQLMSLDPDRLGHATNLSTDPDQCSDVIQLIINHKIPLEICLTSNMMTSTIPNLKSHHLEYWMSIKHTFIAICTDDKGLFSTTLSQEFALAFSTFNLSKEDIWRINCNSIHYIFSSQHVKERLKKIFSTFNFN